LSLEKDGKKVGFSALAYVLHDTTSAPG